jgi:hypothetical protein
MGGRFICELLSGNANLPICALVIANREIGVPGNDKHDRSRYGIIFRVCLSKSSSAARAASSV